MKAGVRNSLSNSKTQFNGLVCAWKSFTSFLMHFDVLNDSLDFFLTPHPSQHFWLRTIHLNVINGKVFQNEINENWEKVKKDLFAPAKFMETKIVDQILPDVPFSQWMPYDELFCVECIWENFFLVFRQFQLFRSLFCKSANKTINKFSFQWKCKEKIFEISWKHLSCKQLVFNSTIITTNP